MTACLYVVEFASGTIKVGQTETPQRRLGEHAKTARIHGDEMTRWWFSDPHEDCEHNENALIRFCAARWEIVAGNEYFKAADFDVIAEYAYGLCSRASLTEPVPVPADAPPPTIQRKSRRRTPALSPMAIAQRRAPTPLKPKPVRRRRRG